MGVSDSSRTPARIRVPALSYRARLQSRGRFQQATAAVSRDRGRRIGPCARVGTAPPCAGEIHRNGRGPRGGHMAGRALAGILGAGAIPSVNGQRRLPRAPRGGRGVAEREFAPARRSGPARSMASTALRQRDLFEAPLDTVEVWVERLTGAFADAKADTSVLALAEAAVAACPTNLELLLMAAMAAVLDGHPKQALVFLDRSSRWGRAPAAHLLRALALNQLGRRAAAKALLQQHELTDRRAALSVLPRGFPCLLQLTAPVDSIMRGPAQSP